MKRLLIVLAVLALAVPAGAQVYINGQGPAAVTTCSDPLPLAQITDCSTLGLPLLCGGGAEDPMWSLLKPDGLDPTCETCTAGDLIMRSNGSSTAQWANALDLQTFTVVGPPSPITGTRQKAFTLNGAGWTLTQSFNATGEPDEYVTENTVTLGPDSLVCQNGDAVLTLYSGGLSLDLGEATLAEVRDDGTLIGQSLQVSGTADSGTGGADTTLTGGNAGAAETDSDGLGGGSVEITGGAGSALNGTGTNDGNGGNVILLGGQAGGTGTSVVGIVQVGTPSVQSTRAQNLLAVAGGLEVDGESFFDGEVHIGGQVTSNGNVLSLRGDQGDAEDTGYDAEFRGGAGGVAGTDGDGQDGGIAEIRGGIGTALNGAGTNDGSGGDVYLTGGAAGGTTGAAVAGIVRVGIPSVQSTKTIDLLAVAGGLEVDGAVRLDSTLGFKGYSQALSNVVAITDATPSAFMTVTLAAGEMVGGAFAYTITATDATDYQAHAGFVTYSAVRKAGAITCAINEAAQLESGAVSAGTLTDAFTCADTTDEVTFSINANSSLTTPTMSIRYTVIQNQTYQINGVAE